MAFDAVFAGAGHNALATAVHLAGRGWSVGVFEQSDVAGGAVRTAEVTLPGFQHDLGATNLGLFAGSAFHKAYGETLAKRGLADVPADHCFASPMPNGRWFGVSKDLETNTQIFILELSWFAGRSRRAPGQASRISTQYG